MPKADPIKNAYERAFNGCNRTSLSWAAYQAGWNAAKQSDQAIYADIAEHYHRSVWEKRKAEAWKARDLNCGCDHNEYCGKCWPVEFRKGGEFYEWTGEPSRNPLANCAETSSSPAAAPIQLSAIEPALYGALASWHEIHGTPAEPDALDRLARYLAAAVIESEPEGSLVGLPQGDGLVTGLGDVDQRIPMPARDAEEEAAGIVNLGLDGSEHDAEATGSAGPHGGDATPVGWIYEDTLPPEYSCDTMFPHSQVRDGVRMFPVFAHVKRCPLCDARPGQEHAPACPRHPSDPMGVRGER